MSYHTLHHPNGGNPDARCAEFYRRVLRALDERGIRYLIGGGYAMEVYTRVRRATKDIDLFVMQRDLPRIFEAMGRIGHHAELVEPHWLGKIYDDDEFIDVIFGAGNALGQVEESWFEKSVESQVLGRPVRLCAPEEMIWHKAFVMARDRYDGADVAHLLSAWGETLDWNRLLYRFGDHWRVLLGHLVLFGYVYPGHRTLIPPWLMDTLLVRLQDESLPAQDDAANLCRGPFLSRADYRQAIDLWGYQNACPAPLLPAA